MHSEEALYINGHSGFTIFPERLRTAQTGFRRIGNVLSKYVRHGAWIYAGGSHHTGISQALTSDHLADFAQIAGIEFLSIDDLTNLEDFRKELRWNDAYNALRAR